VTYSGLISLGVALASMCTSLVFITIVTRMLSQQEYGAWGLINGLFAYGLITNGIINFWTVRDIARGRDVGKTSILSSGAFSIIGVSIFIVASLGVAPQLNIEINVLFLAAILLPANFIQKIISAINKAWKPQIASYGLLISEIIKIPLVLFFVYILDLGIIGVIFTVFLAVISNIIIQVIMSRGKIKGQFDLQILKKWLKVSWVPLYPKINGILFTSDIIIFSILTGSVIGASYFSAALVLASFTVYVKGISTSVYPKLLSGNKVKIITRNLTYLFFFSIPLILIAIVFSKQGLIILNPIYENAVIVVIFLTFRTFLVTLSGILENFLYGIENVDKNIKSTFKEYVKSKLFVIPTLRIVQSGTYLLVLTVVIFLFVNNSSDIELVTYWSIVAMISPIPLTCYLLYLVIHNFQIKFEINSIIKYILVGASSFFFVNILVEKFFIYDESVFNLILQVIGFVILGGSLYLLFTYITDNTCRNLVKSIILEIKKR
jgi:O-antigen/teichoic acid export membrane protein